MQDGCTIWLATLWCVNFLFSGRPVDPAAHISLRCCLLNINARNLQACFLTRGDLYVSWEKGRDTFDRLLVDADWAVNNGNWMWLSASAFFTQYFRVYSPITFGQKYDKKGEYVRYFLPVLKVRLRNSTFMSVCIVQCWDCAGLACAWSCVDLGSCLQDYPDKYIYSPWVSPSRHSWCLKLRCSLTQPH